MPESYLPNADEGLRAWSLNFRTRLAADPAAYGLTAPEVEAYTQRQQLFSDRLTTALDPITRGGSTVFAKNQARVELVSISRLLAMQITNDPSTTDQQRYDLGLTVRDNTPTPRPAISTSPTINILEVAGKTVSMRVSDETNPTRRGRPANAQGVAVFAYVGENPPADTSDWATKGMFPGTKFDITFGPDVAPASKVWITAFWIGPAMKNGPMTSPVSTFLQGGAQEGGEVELRIAA